MTTDAPISALQARLHSNDAGVRRVAVLEFADDAQESLISEIIALVRHDPESQLRSEAARALAGWDRADVVEALAAALQDVQPVREAAADSLAELKTSAVGVALLPYAEHSDAFVAGAALRALRELRLPAAAEPALAALTHAAATVRREAVGVLGWLKLATALPRLSSLAVEDTDMEVRRAATGALGLAAPENDIAVPALINALRDSAWQVREEAATTLGKFGYSNSIAAALRQAMEDDHWQVRLRAARSLGRLRDQSALPLLIESLLHPAGNLRREAAIALGEIGDARAIDALRAASADPDPEVRKAARLATERLVRP
jgi:HEAT repeat protein